MDEQGKIVPARGPKDFGMMLLSFDAQASLTLDMKNVPSLIRVFCCPTDRLGSHIRMRRRDVCGDGQGKEEWPVAPRVGIGEVERVAQDTVSSRVENSNLW